MRSGLKFGATALSLALAAGTGCSHMEAKTPTIDSARLLDLPASELSLVRRQQGVIDDAKRKAEQARADVHRVNEERSKATASYELAKAEAKKAKATGEVARKEIEAGVPQQAAQSGEVAPMSNVFVAEVGETAAKQRVAYLDDLEKFASERAKVADRNMTFQQAQLEKVEFDTLQRTRPQEAAASKTRAADFAAYSAKRQADVESARADQLKELSKAKAKFQTFNATSQRLPENLRTQAMSPDAIPPL